MLDWPQSQVLSFIIIQSYSGYYHRFTNIYSSLSCLEIKHYNSQYRKVISCTPIYIPIVNSSKCNLIKLIKNTQHQNNELLLKILERDFPVLLWRMRCDGNGDMSFENKPAHLATVNNAGLGSRYLTVLHHNWKLQFDKYVLRPALKSRSLYRTIVK